MVQLENNMQIQLKQKSVDGVKVWEWSVTDGITTHLGGMAETADIAHNDATLTLALHEHHRLEGLQYFIESLNKWELLMLKECLNASAEDHETLLDEVKAKISDWDKI
jgi:hypothetical protein